VQLVARRLEDGGVLPLAGVAAAAQPFLGALLRQVFPRRPVVVVTEGLRTQESFHQDIATWLALKDEAEPKANGKTEPGGAATLTRQDQPAKETPINPLPAGSVSRDSQPLFYPAWEVLPHQGGLPHADVISERLETLVGLAQESNGQASPPFVVTSVVALLQRTYPAGVIRERTRRIERGDRVDPLDLVDWLEGQGYEAEAQVTQKGEIALRGGILDVYPLTSPWPVRLEFFGDELESLRHFDPLTQISRDEISAIIIPPAGELGILKQIAAKAAGPEAPSEPSRPPERVLETLLDYLPRETVLVLCEPDQLEERAAEYAGQIPEYDSLFIGWEEFLNEAVAKGMRLLQLSEMAAENEDGTGEKSEIRNPKSEAGQARTEETEDRIVAKKWWQKHGAAKIAPQLRKIREGPSETNLETLEASKGRKPEEATPGISSQHTFEADLNAEPGALLFQSLDAYRPLGERTPEPQIAEAQRREFFDQIHRWLRQDYAVHVFCNNDGERQRFTEIWAEYGLGSQDGSPALRVGSIARGFLCEPAKVAVVTDAEIFGRYKLQRPRRLKSPHALATRSALDIDFTELEEGDYVVHLQHGIGRYLGLQILPIGAGTKPTEGIGARANAGQECLVIEYAPGDAAQPPPKLYVPVTEAHLVSKYVGAGKARPPLNTLGGTRWAKAKAQAERAVRDVASDLLAIQAARESQAGHAFALDSPWQREFEGAFIFEETPDQMKAIVETKSDMERPKPMDRLICGDVGFGKTEVGIRAAFKAVMDGRQVAVLVPTTVLAQQHFNTFRERMADYPIRVELLSRFRTRRAQEAVVRDLAAGAVDIVIGTHRLLQDDIAFKDLGLVVIDEEQRFGVLHKEKFKMLRRLVDVLTLSATPIPRTLYLALTGARDMSTIQTPPHDRLPVETIVTAYDERVIREAIQRELNRGGQVFFLHNRVMTIDTMAQKLRTLLPHARVVVGHGQMHSDDLEDVMTTFVNGEADVLLSTTIIESGLDIPNANTIIIDRADRFGLSDLYQLRGRVGRYKHQAYAYLLLPRHGGLLTDVRRRLSAIKQYSTLGSGFKIAMRDLEIRGAGNLLGAEQSGHITAVGFELYCQLLKQSVAGLKGEKVKPRVEVPVRLDFLALSPGEGGDTNAEWMEERQAAKALAAARAVPSKAVAWIPFNYISDARQRIEIYRKLAEITDKSGLMALEKELRDRFGPVPAPIGLLLQIAELKMLASERGIAAIEVKDDKLMLTRNNDFIMVGSKFPRLTKKAAAARLKEIKKLLLAL
jgi:transcription-repair coupling factor (superfamily II helicase)